MNTALLIILGGLLVAAVSAGVTYLMVPPLVARRLPELLEALSEHHAHHAHHAHEQEPVMPNTQPQPRPRHITGMTIIVVLVAVIAVLSVQVWLSGRAKARADKDRDAVVSCLETYADQVDTWANGDPNHIGLIRTLQASRDATHELRARTKVWTRRADDIFELLIGSYGGVHYTDATIQGVVDGYQSASAALFEAYAHAQQTNVDYPLPKLKLTCKEETKR